MTIYRIDTTEYVECRATSARGNACTLPEGHMSGGYHLACTDEGDEIEEWREEL